MKRTLRLLAMLLMILAVIGVFNTPLTRSKVAYADGAEPMPTDPSKRPLPPGSSANQ